jgi:inward rectifier potassium channel
MSTPSSQRPRFAERTIRVGIRRAVLRDLYHLLLTASWRRLVALIFVVYAVLNLIFALVYYLEGGLDGARSGSYSDAFFFSVHTMATLSFGKITPRTTFDNVVVTIEALIGLVGLAMTTALMFSKFSRPQARVVFSRFAVITVREGVPSLMLRLGNERRTGLVEAQLRLVLVREETTAEGERFRRITELPLVRANSAMFALSWTVIHRIDDKSPLAGVTSESLIASEAEIVASLVGLEEASAQTIHARYIWGAEDILFGKRFVDVLGKHANGRPLLDFGRFHDTVDDQK